MQVTAYTTEQVDQILAAYAAGQDVSQIAEKVGRTTRSVIAKLAQLGVYKSPEKAAAARVTKAQVIDEIAALLQCDREVLDSLEKATMPALATLLAAVKE